MRRRRLRSNPNFLSPLSWFSAQGARQFVKHLLGRGWRSVGALLGLLAWPHAVAAEAGYTIGAHPVALADSLPVGQRVGKLRFLGMLQLPAANISGARLADLSDLAWDEDEQVLYAISNKGVLFWLRPHFTGDALTDVSVLRAFPLYDLDNKKRLTDRRADAEGLDILNGDNGRRGDSELLISFERIPRIVSYRTNGAALHEHPLPAALNGAGVFRGDNQSLESVAYHPRLGVLTAPEVRLKGVASGQTHIYALDGSSWRYPLADDSSIVSLKASGKRAVMVLERAYVPLYGRIVVKIKEATLNAGGTSAVETLAALDSRDGLLLDNFEGLTRHRGRRYFIVSDNNSMFFQRTLLLYFERLP